MRPSCATRALHLKASALHQNVPLQGGSPHKTYAVQSRKRWSSVKPQANLMPSHLVTAGIPFLYVIPGTLVKTFILASNGEVDLPRMALISQVRSGLRKQVAWVADLNGWGGQHGDDSWKSNGKPVQHTHLLCYLG